MVDARVEGYSWVPEGTHGNAGSVDALSRAQRAVAPSKSVQDAWQELRLRRRNSQLRYDKKLAAGKLQHAHIARNLINMDLLEIRDSDSAKRGSITAQTILPVQGNSSGDLRLLSVVTVHCKATALTIIMARSLLAVSAATSSTATTLAARTAQWRSRRDM